MIIAALLGVSRFVTAYIPDQFSRSERGDFFIFSRNLPNLGSMISHALPSSVISVHNILHDVRWALCNRPLHVPKRWQSAHTWDNQARVRRYEPHRRLVPPHDTGQCRRASQFLCHGMTVQDSPLGHGHFDLTGSPCSGCDDCFPGTVVFRIFFC